MKNKRIFLSAPHMDGQEREFVNQAFDSNYIAPLGPQVDAFERGFAADLETDASAALVLGVSGGGKGCPLISRIYTNFKSQ